MNKKYLLFFSFDSLEDWFRSCQKVNAGLDKQPMFGLVNNINLMAFTTPTIESEHFFLPAHSNS